MSESTINNVKNKIIEYKSELAISLTILVVLIVLYVLYKYISSINSAEKTNVSKKPIRLSQSSESNESSESSESNESSQPSESSEIVAFSEEPLNKYKNSVYVTQVFKCTPAVDSGTSYTGSGAPKNWSKSVVTNGGVCSIDLSFTASVSTAQSSGIFGFYIDGVMQGESYIYYYFTNANEHMSIPSCFMSIDDIPAGSHTFELRINDNNTSGVVVDSADLLNIRVTEYMPSIIGPDSPAVYITSVLNQMPPVGKSSITFNNYGIPPMWSTQFESNGGIFVIDLDFTITSSAGTQSMLFAVLINERPLTPFIYNYFDIKDSYVTVAAHFFDISLPADSYTLELYIDYRQVQTAKLDISHTLNLRVTEYMPSIVKSPSSFVYIIPVFKTVSPVAGSYYNSGIPDQWTNTIKTNGGTCVFSLDFTACSSRPGNNVNFALIIDDVPQLPLMSYYFSKSAQHYTIPSTFPVVQLPAGDHSIGIYINYNNTSGAFVNSHDILNMRIIEYTSEILGAFSE
jgi:hypothetical protein